MESRQLTQEATAAILGVEKSTLVRWLNGSTRPSLDEAFRIQTVFGLYAGMWAAGLSPAEVGK
jgi:transcriptional regulator with XRE-family HTH domain